MKEIVLQIRVTKAESDLYAAQAKKSGVKLSCWCRDALSRYAAGAPIPQKAEPTPPPVKIKKSESKAAKPFVCLLKGIK